MARKLSFTNYMIFTVVTVFLLVHSSNSEKTADSQYIHPDTGLSCYYCKPGEYRVDYCSQNGGKSVCQPCKPGMYNTHYTIADHCVPCDTCREREEADKNCTLISNTSCVCREEFYRDSSNQCVLQTECPPGRGVHTQGNRFRETKCEICETGYFSNVTSKTERCKKCSVCSGSNERVLSECTPTNNTVCELYEPKIDYGLILGLTFGIGVPTLLAIALVCWLFRSESGRRRLQAIKICCPGSPDYRPSNGQDSHYIGSEQDGIPLISATLLNDHEVRKVSEDLIFPEYQMFFRYLFSEDADKHINEVHLDYANSPVREKVYQLLKKWQVVEKDNATKNNFIAALKEHNKNLLAEKYSREWNISEVNSDIIDSPGNCDSAARTSSAPGETAV